ncbi:MAG TPA: Asp-tRNA(Asn)/Glu-tRNA(Gln) amidotransferase subunit GatC [Longimicrobiaceae bacterium]|nr:Asp-tRNA(Asn)/Glu-tRNA(Gln) amidotransferase subunit GatC [Longimicrobiaceae bacterium]
MKDPRAWGAAIDRDDVRRLAALARIRLGDDEVQSLSDDLTSILRVLLPLDSLDVSELAGRPPVDAEQIATTLRPDEVAPTHVHRPLTELAPSWREGFYTVPRIPALDPEARSGNGSSEE